MASPLSFRGDNMEQVDHDAFVETMKELDNE